MSHQPSAQHDNNKRKTLRVAAKLMFGVAMLAFVVLLFSSLSGPEPKAKPVPTMLVQTSDIDSAMAEFALWHGRPVMIYRRTAADLLALSQAAQPLIDPHSNKSIQPDFAQTEHRSKRPEWFVAFSSGTDQGCPIEHFPAGGEVLEEPWLGGFRDTCAGSVYDYAGRVFAGQSATKNLAVPPYSFRANGAILLGGSE